MTYVIAEPCIDVLDPACVDECRVDCISEGERAPGGAARTVRLGVDTPLVAACAPGAG